MSSNILVASRLLNVSKTKELISGFVNLYLIEDRTLLKGVEESALNPDIPHVGYFEAMPQHKA